MALDIYVGPLTRYYVRNWETVAARMCREQGIPYNVIRPNSTSDALSRDPAVILNKVRVWREWLAEQLKADFPNGISWEERTDGKYYTDRPAWEGYVGVVLLAAHTDHPEFPMPENPLTEWQEDAAFLASIAPEFQNNESGFSLLYETETWLPLDFAFKFAVADAIGNTSWFGSSVALLTQLRYLNDNTYRASHADLASWREEGVVGATTFDQTARFGLAMFMHLAELSVEHNLPMKLDY